MGVESRLDELAKYNRDANGPFANALEHDERQDQSGHDLKGRANPGSQAATFIKSVDTQLGCPTMRLQALQRRPCNPLCHCTCHKTRRIASPGFLERLLGKLFVGYSGLPSVFRNCTVLGCRQDSSKLVKVTYSFPYWFWQRAVNAAFSYTFATGPELLLRFPCVRPAHSEWFICARMGDADGLKRLLGNKQAGRTLRCSHFFGWRRSAN